MTKGQDTNGQEGITITAVVKRNGQWYVARRGPLLTLRAGHETQYQERFEPVTRLQAFRVMRHAQDMGIGVQHDDNGEREKYYFGKAFQVPRLPEPVITLPAAAAEAQREREEVA